MMAPFCASTRASMSGPQCALHLLITLSRLPVPREGYSSGKLNVSGIPRSPSDVHTTGGSFYVFWLAHQKDILSSDARQLRYSHHSHSAWALFCQFCKTEQKRKILGFFLHNVSVPSRQNLILDNKVSYFHSLYLL